MDEQRTIPGELCAMLCFLDYFVSRETLDAGNGIIYDGIPQEIDPASPVFPEDAVAAAGIPVSRNFIQTYCPAITGEEADRAGTAFLGLCAKSLEKHLENAQKSFVHGAAREINEIFLEKGETILIDDFPLDGTVPLSIVWLDNDGNIHNGVSYGSALWRILGSATKKMLDEAGWADIASNRLRCAPETLATTGSGFAYARKGPSSPALSGFPEGISLVSDVGLMLMRFFDETGCFWSDYRHIHAPEKNWTALLLDFDPSMLEKFPIAAENSSYSRICAGIANTRRNCDGISIMKKVAGQDFSGLEPGLREFVMAAASDIDIFFAAANIDRAYPGLADSADMRRLLDILSRVPIQLRLGGLVAPFSVAVIAQKLEPGVEQDSAFNDGTKKAFGFDDPKERDLAGIHLPVIRLTIGLQPVFPRNIGDHVFFPRPEGPYITMPGREIALVNSSVMDIPEHLATTREGFRMAQECLGAFLKDTAPEAREYLRSAMTGGAH